jgi:hypothetical protein
LLKKINADREGLNVQAMWKYRLTHLLKEASPSTINWPTSARMSAEGLRKAAAQSNSKVTHRYRRTLYSSGLGRFPEAGPGHLQIFRTRMSFLRVLSMYKDPEQREQQIRNMSEGFPRVG